MHAGLKSKPGFLTFGDKDERVNYRLTQKLIADLNSLIFIPTSHRAGEGIAVGEFPDQKLSFKSLAGVGHESRLQDLKYVTSWLETTWQ
jgi:hypothetical protein